LDWSCIYGPFKRGDKYKNLNPTDLIKKAHKKFQEVSKNKPYAILEFGVTEL
jgi:hypothetical protein